MTLIFFVVGPASAAFYQSMPKKVFDPKKSTITCKESGRIFSALELGLTTDMIYQFDETFIRDSCVPKNNDPKQIGKTISAEEFAKYKGKITLAGEYEFQKNYYVEGNWLQAIGMAFLSIISAIFAFELFKRTFFYIVTGKFIKLK